LRRLSNPIIVVAMLRSTKEDLYLITYLYSGGKEEDCDCSKKKLHGLSKIESVLVLVCDLRIYGLINIYKVTFG
jgi:hypothetical protein